MGILVQNRVTKKIGEYHTHPVEKNIAIIWWQDGDNQLIDLKAIPKSIVILDQKVARLLYDKEMRGVK